MLGEPSRVALITTSFGSIEASGIGISGVELGRVSVKSCVCPFSYSEYDSILLYFSSQLHYVQADSLNELQECLYWYRHTDITFYDLV